MKLHYLTKLSDGKRQRKSVGVFPAERKMTTASGRSKPDGYAYLPVEDKPPYDEKTQVREENNTNEKYGWTVRDKSPDELKPILQPVSKFRFYKGMKQLKKWKAFKTLLKSQGYEDAQEMFSLVSALDPNDPDFMQLAPAIKAGLTLTDEQYDSLFLP